MECVMKKYLLLLAVVFIVLAFAVSCKSPPPPAAPAVTVSPPPPPPPPQAPEAPAVEISPPVLAVNLTPQPFSPDGDGVDDSLTVRISVNSRANIKSWRIEIREPGDFLFSEWSGDGTPPQTFTWDGLSSSGELVQSATDYQFTLEVTTVQNISATAKGTIQVDVLVRREANGVLRVIVPSIMFAANKGNSSNLPSETMLANDRILRRIAEVLNRYPTYQVMVEGHANPTTPPATQARAVEEIGNSTLLGLRPLSEERAKYVADYLINLGVAGSRLTPVGIGGIQPVAAFTDWDNWWKNRRVEFILVK